VCSRPHAAHASTFSPANDIFTWCSSQVQVADRFHGKRAQCTWPALWCSAAGLVQSAARCRMFPAAWFSALHNAGFLIQCAALCFTGNICARQAQLGLRSQLRHQQFQPGARFSAGLHGYIQLRQPQINGFQHRQRVAPRLRAQLLRHKRMDL